MNDNAPLPTYSLDLDENDVRSLSAQLDAASRWFGNILSQTGLQSVASTHRGLSESQIWIARLQHVSKQLAEASKPEEG